MSLIRRFKAAHVAGALKRAGSLAPEALSDIRARLKSMGGEAVPPLLQLLGDGEARRPAILSLVDLLTDETLPAYLDALGGDNLIVANAVTEVLVQSTGYNPVRLLDLLSDATIPKARLEAILDRHLARIPPRTLITLLADVHKETRPIVFRLLEKRADATVVPEALRLLAHEDLWVRTHMARLLGGFPGGEAISGLIRLLMDPAKSVRLEAVKSLGRLKALAAVPQLCAALRDVDLKVHTAAIEALVTIGDPSAVGHLVDVLKDESEYARRGAVEVLNEVVTVEAIKDLVQALRDEDWWVRVRAADALGTLGGPKVVEAVIGLMRDPDEFIRRYAVEILNTIPDERAVEPLLEALADQDWWVRERSIDALGRIRDPRSVEPLLSLLRQEPQAAPHCVRALREIGDLRALETFIRLTHAENAELRREAAEALQALSRVTTDPEGKSLVMAALDAAGLAIRQEGRPMEIRPAGREAVDLEFGRGGEVRRPQGHAPAGEPAPPARTEAGAGTGPATPTGGGPRTEVFGPGEAARPAARLNYHDLAPDTLLLDRYRVIRKVGGGGFGTVYLAEDRAIGDELILKVLNPYLSADPMMTRRFVQELKLSRRVSHPNVIRIHDFMDLEGGHAISMEYCPGTDLARILEAEGSLPAARALPLVAQVLDGLGAAHEQGIIHRDVKPANCLVGDEDRVKVVDFGLAAAGQSVGSRLTKSGILIGTPEYMAPELITGGEVDHRCDLYAVGVMLYETLSGVKPFIGETAVNILFQHLEADAKPLGQLVPDLPEELEKIVMGAMARERADRPATALALREALLGVLRRAA